MNNRLSLDELLSRELDYRRTKQWNIFQWCSTLLVAITGGVIFLRTGGYQLRVTEQVPITVAVIVLSAYAFFWLSYNATQEKQIADHVTETSGWPLRGKHPWMGFRGAVALLMVAAMLAIWLPLSRTNPRGNRGTSNTRSKLKPDKARCRRSRWSSRMVGNSAQQKRGQTIALE